MIIVKLMGGLGNQLFQYAVGRALSKKLNTKLKLDLNFLTATHANVTPRNYELKHFNIKAEFANQIEISKFNLYRGNNKVRRIFTKISRLITKSYCYNEKCIEFDEKLLNLRGDLYLNGYWQSEKYFSEISNIIKKELSVPLLFSDYSKQIGKSILKTNSVSIHIRRGDYIQNSDTLKIYHTCNENYYKEAIDIVAGDNENVELYVFSDDIQWVSKNYNLKFPCTFIRSESTIEEFRLMSLCNNNIIANSSFSWWAAWLNSNPNKIVVSPKLWFRDLSKNTNDMVPDNWLRI